MQMTAYALAHRLLSSSEHLTPTDATRLLDEVLAARPVQESTGTPVEIFLPPTTRPHPAGDSPVERRVVRETTTWTVEEPR
jgi:hypothetical protein